MKSKKKASSSSDASVAGASGTAAVADSTVSDSSVTKRSTRRSTRLDKKDKVSDDEPKAGSSGHQSNSKSIRTAINGRSGANIDSGQQQQTKTTKLDTDKKATSLLKMKKRSTSVPAVFSGKAEDLVRRSTRAAAKGNHSLIDNDEQMQAGSGGKSTNRSGVTANNKQPHQINAKSTNALATVSGSGGNQANRASNDNNKRNGKGAAATGRGRSSADFDSSDDEDEQIRPTKLRKKAPLAKKRSKSLPAVVSSSDEEEEGPKESTRPRRSTRNAAKKSKVIVDVTEPKAGPSGCRRSNQRSVANNHKQPQSSPQANGDSDSEAKPQEEEEEEEWWGKPPSDSDSPEYFEYMRNSVHAFRERDTASEAHTASEDEVEEVTHDGKSGVLYKLRCQKGTLTVLRLVDWLKRSGRFYTVLPNGEHDEWYDDDYYTNDGHPIEWEFHFAHRKPFTVKSLTAAGVRRWEKKLRKRQQYKEEQAAIKARNAQLRAQYGTTPEQRAARRQKRRERRRRLANGTMPTREEEYLDGLDDLESLWNTVHEETETDSTVDEEHADVITLSSGPEDEVIQLSD